MTRRILVVDGDAMIRTLVAECLMAFGYLVQTVPHPQEGLEMIWKDPPDILILDLQLPEMSGFDVLSKLRASPLTHNLPVLMLSANADIQLHAETDKADAYLMKPFNLEQLLRAVESVERGPS